VTWQTYGSFHVAVVLVLVPGPDFAVVTENTLAGIDYRLVGTVSAATT
jgi:threonine/homoserine/homoserine lactone efflux protein